MSLEEKVGQLFIVGFPQTKMDSTLRNFIQAYKPGAFLLFKRNIISVQQISELNSELYQLSFKATRLPPLLAVDQEGGSVSRLPIFPSPPNFLALGQTQSSFFAEELGFQTGGFLRKVGFNLNLAPVLDVANPLTESFIGVRSLSGDPQIVKDLGFAYSKGLLRASVIPTAKHFPGTGSLPEDPHRTIVKNHSSKEDIYSKDLLPYREFSKLGPSSAVMLSHSIYPLLDSDGIPASFSRHLIQEVLRHELSFEGVVITDDLQMKGSSQIFNSDVSALRALQAGADMVMIAYSFADQQRAFSFVSSSIRKGLLSEREVNEKLKRILRAKAFANSNYLKENNPTLVQSHSLTSLGYQKLEAEILQRNLALNLMVDSLPQKKVTKRHPSSEQIYCLISANRKFFSSFLKNVSRRHQSLFLDKQATLEDIRSWIDNERCQKITLVVTGSKTASYANTLFTTYKENFIAINLSSPKLFTKNKGPRVLNLYYHHDFAGREISKKIDALFDTPSQPAVFLR